MVSVKGLRYCYGKVCAVDNISFDIKKGQIFSFLGPNGAGKTTTINLLITLLPIQEGKLTIAGYDVAKQKEKVRESIGVVFQDQRLDRDLTVWETLEFHGKLYSIPKRELNSRIEELLELVELHDKKDEFTKNLSGGMKRRLEIARGLLVKPKVLFLDEPTIGLDTQSRKRIWSYIRRVNREEGITVLLTTHYMEEADQNSDAICIIDRGKIIANGTPGELKNSLGQNQIRLQTGNDQKALQIIKTMHPTQVIRETPDGLLVSSKEEKVSINEIVDTLRNVDVSIESVSVAKPTLDDVFIQYTGRGLNAANQDNGGYSAEQEATP